MELNQAELQKINNLIKQHNRFAVIPHRSPDGDTLGCSLALFHVLKDLGKNVEVICLDAPSDEFRFLPGIESVKCGQPSLDFDAYFILDAGAPHLTGLHEDIPSLFDKSKEVVNLDHHRSNDFYGRYNLVDANAASATMVLYEMLTALNYPINRQIATCLLTGIYTDTGSFMHSNTDARVLRTASRLVAKGADLKGISKEIFRTTKISTMKLWGRVLRNISQDEQGITMSVIKKKDFEESGADYTEMSGAVDYVNSVPGSTYSVILTEREGKVKGSLRTLKDEVDVAEIASKYGGGGHTKAAGFTLTGRLQQEVRWKVVNE